MSTYYSNIKRRTKELNSYIDALMSVAYYAAVFVTDCLAVVTLVVLVGPINTIPTLLIVPHFKLKMVDII